MATIASLVVQIGADIADLKKNVDKAGDTLGGIEKTAKAVGAAMATAFTAAAIQQWVMKAIDAASQINNLSKKLDVSTDAVQRWSHAATMGGASIDAVDRAVSFMNKSLAGGDKSTVSALHSAGLKFDDIRKMRPEDAFDTIADAIGRMENPFKRAEVAARLFSKSGQELIPAMVDGWTKTGDAADVMSGKTVRALAEAGDEIDRWSNWFTVKLGGTLAKLSDDWNRFWGKLTGPVKLLTGTLDNEVATSVAGLVKSFDKQQKSTVGSTESIEAANKALADFDKANKKNEDQMKKSHAAQDAYNAALRDMANQFTGKKLADEVTKIGSALKIAGGAANMSAYEKEKLGKQLAELRAQGAKLTPEMLKLSDAFVSVSWSGTIDDLKEFNQALIDTARFSWSGTTDDIKEFGAALNSAVSWSGVQWSGVQEDLDNLSNILGEGGKAAGGAFADGLGAALGRNIMGAIQGGGDIIAAAGSTVGSYLMSDKGIGDTITKGAKSLFGDKLGGAIGAALPGLGAMIGPMISNLFGKLFGSAGRDSVEEFAKSMGGFASLREKLLPLGDVGEKLWVNLTQGVGKNNPEQAKAAIEAITKALEEQRGFIEGLVPSWQDTLSLAEKYGIEVSGLGEKFQQAKLAEMANDIAVDFRKLIAAGADMNAVLAGMQDEVQGVVSDALKMGLDIPDSMKPIIQKLIDMGKLTDENGNKLTDMSKLNFSETLSKSVERIIEALDRLIATLGGGVKDAIDKLPKKVNIDVDWNIKTPNLPGGGKGEETTSFHNGGIVKAHNGLNKILPFGRLGTGEVPIIAQSGEAVLNRRAVARLGENGVAGLNGGAGGGQVINMGEVVAALNAQRAEARRAAALAPAQMARAVRDALLLAR